MHNFLFTPSVVILSGHVELGLATLPDLVSRQQKKKTATECAKYWLSICIKIGEFTSSVHPQTASKIKKFNIGKNTQIMCKSKAEKLSYS